MYDIELQQNVYLAVIELTSAGKIAYTADVAKLLYDRTEGERLEPLEQRIRYMLKKLTRVGVLDELEGESTKTKIKKLHYKQNGYYIMFGMKKKVEDPNQEKKEQQSYAQMFMMQILGALGGPLGAMTWVSKQVMSKEDKIAEAIETRKEQLIKEDKLKPKDVLSFSFSENKGKLMVMELGITDNGTKDLGTYVISRYNIQEFSDLILKLLKTQIENKNGNSQNPIGGIEPAPDNK